MKLVPLKALGSIYTGNTPSKKERKFYEAKDIPFIKPDIISDSKLSEITHTEEYISNLARNNARIIPKNSILVTCIGSIGKIGITGPGEYAFNQQINAIVPNAGINVRYLAYCLLFNKKKLCEIANNAVVPIINKKQFSDFCVSINPDIKVQKDIVRTLDILACIIKHRQSQLAKLDELVKCRFVELFGDPILNEKKWITKPVKELTTKVGSGATPKGGDSSYKDSGISLIRSLNVHNNIFKTKELAHIDNEQANQLSNVTIQSGDVLLNITGASVARCCIVPDDILPARVNQHVCIIRCNDMLNPLFLERLLTSDNYQTYLWNVAEGGGGTRQALTKQQIENVSIITPPITLQATFATFVSRIDKLRFVIQQSLDEAQKLFDSLMQKYFD